MKKILVTFFGLALVFSLSAQTKSDVSSTGFGNNLNVAATGNNSFGASTTFTNPKRRVEGTYYLYDTWKNDAIVFTSDKQRFIVKNVNINLKHNVFEAKIDDDELFVFNFNNIDKFVIAGKEYKNYFWDDDNKVYQVIYESNEFQLLKGHNVKYVEGSANPMLNRANDRYVRQESYYLRQEGKIKKFKLKKKRLLKLFDGNEAKVASILEYADNNNLSFSSENDIKKILEYSAKN